MDRAAVGERHLVRQLAPRRQVAGDVRVVGGDTVQMLGVVWGRIKMQGACASRPRPLPRIGRASRSDINPLTGSDGSVPHRRAWCKGVCKKRGSSHQVRISFFSITPLRTGKACGIISSSQPPRLSAVRHDARIWRLLFYADTKPYQSIEQQIALLESRGLAIDVDADVAKRFLANVNYYRQNRSDLF